MIKTIKFNLILDNRPIRTIEDLKDNFSIEDILTVYKNGLLQRWLEVRNYLEFLEKVNSIDEKNDIDIITRLITIFQIEIEEEKIKEGVSILKYKEAKKMQLDKYNILSFKTQTIIDEYHSGYKALINDILKDSNNMAKIKAHIKELEQNYLELFDLNFYDLYFELMDKAPLAIFAILMNNKLRNCFINNESNEHSSDSLFIKQNHIKEIHESITKFVNNNSISEISWHNKYDTPKEIKLKTKLGDNLKIFSGNTQQYWKDVEQNGSKFMIIKIEENNFIRNSGKNGQQYSAKDINGNFIILDGIDYMSNFENDNLLYMEV